MGKWAARLAEKTAAPYSCGTDKTDKRGVLSVLAVTPEGGAADFQAAPTVASEPTDPPEALDLVAVAWSDADIARFNNRRARLIRWGWPMPEAEALAERLTQRDREGDDRVSCADCRHYRRGRCGNHAQAGIGGPEVGRELAAMLQRCRGFSATPSAAG